MGGRAWLTKVEHGVDLETEAIVGLTVQDADDGDTETSLETLIEAAEQVEAVRPEGDGIDEIAGGTGRRTRRPATRCTAIVGAFRARAAGACCDSAESVWNGPSPLSMRPVGCAGCIFAAARTSASAC